MICNFNWFEFNLIFRFKKWLKLQFDDVVLLFLICGRHFVVWKSLATCSAPESMEHWRFLLKFSRKSSKVSQVSWLFNRLGVSSRRLFDSLIHSTPFAKISLIFINFRLNCYINRMILSYVIYVIRNVFNRLV